MVRLIKQKGRSSDDQASKKYRPTEPPVRTVFTVRITLPAPSLNPESSVISRSPNSVGQ